MGKKNKQTWKSLLSEKHLLRKPIHFSVKNTANNADTWGFTQQSFQHLYRTAKFIWIPSWLRFWQHKFIDINVTAYFARKNTAQIHRYWQQHISPGKIQHKFTDISNSTFRQKKYSTNSHIGNSIFHQESSNAAVKFSDGFTPYSLFSLNGKEQ